MKVLNYQSTACDDDNYGSDKSTYSSLPLVFNNKKIKEKDTLSDKKKMSEKKEETISLT